jgi:hypothetical protein
VLAVDRGLLSPVSPEHAMSCAVVLLRLQSAHGCARSELRRMAQQLQAASSRADSLAEKLTAAEVC